MLLLSAQYLWFLRETFPPLFQMVLIEPLPQSRLRNGYNEPHQNKTPQDPCNNDWSRGGHMPQEGTFGILSCINMQLLGKKDPFLADAAKPGGNGLEIVVAIFSAPQRHPAGGTKPAPRESHAEG